MKKAILFCTGLLFFGCSQASSLSGKANAPHNIMARWNLKVHGLSGGAPEEYLIQVWEKGTTFRAHVNATFPEMGGPSKEDSDILCDGNALWQFNRGEGIPNIKWEPADKQMLNPYYFWHIPDVTYTVDGSEKVAGRDCPCLKTTQQDMTRNTLDISCWIDPNLGYLMKRKNLSGGEIIGGESECLETQANPSFPAGHFDPPQNAEKSTVPPKLWGIGLKI